MFEEIGTKVIISDFGLIEICNDKWKTYMFLKNHGFHVPKPYISLQTVIKALEKGGVHYTIVIKSRFGCGSIAASIAEDETDLYYYSNKNDRMINKTYLKYT